METTDKPLTRDALISMQVIDAKGRLVGKVKDIAFAVGKTGIALSVENDSGEIQHVPWENVQAAADFILLKPASQTTSMSEEKTVFTVGRSNPQQQSAQESSLTEEEKVFGPYEQQKQSAETSAEEKPSTQPLCPTCGKPLTWIPQYKRWYCYNDKKYVSVN